MKQLTVMAVDDDQDDLDLFKQVLLELDQKVNLIVAYNGKEAIERLSKLDQKPDVIFLDYNMPLMNGMECLSVIKKDPLLKYIPILMHSTNLSNQEINECEMLGATILLKRNTFSNMVSDLRSILADIRNKVSVS